MLMLDGGRYILLDAPSAMSLAGCPAPRRDACGRDHYHEAPVRWLRLPQAAGVRGCRCQPGCAGLCCAQVAAAGDGRHGPGCRTASPGCGCGCGAVAADRSEGHGQRVAATDAPLHHGAFPHDVSRLQSAVAPKASAGQQGSAGLVPGGRPASFGWLADHNCPGSIDASCGNRAAYVHYLGSAAGVCTNQAACEHNQGSVAVAVRAVQTACEHSLNSAVGARCDRAATGAAGTQTRGCDHRDLRLAGSAPHVGTEMA